MTPTVTQQLQSISNMMTKAILPALPADNGFAQEQAGLIVACLNWMTDVQESEARYGAVEHDEWHVLVEDLQQLLPATGDEHAAVQGLLAAPTPAGVDVPGTRLRTAKLKRCAEQVYASVTAGDDAGARTRARELMTAAAQRQCTREQSWARMTGFPKRVEGAIDAVLDAQEAGRQ